jgi:hypothetical protein
MVSCHGRTIDFRPFPRVERNWDVKFGDKERAAGAGGRARSVATGSGLRPTALSDAPHLAYRTKLGAWVIEKRVAHLSFPRCCLCPREAALIRQPSVVEGEPFKAAAAIQLPAANTSIWLLLVPASLLGRIEPSVGDRVAKE